MSKIYLSLVELKKISQYKTSFLLNLFFLFLSILIQISIIHVFWYKYAYNEELWSQAIIYVIFSTAIYNCLEVARVPEFAENVKNGKVVKYFIRPMDLFHQTFLQEMGNSLIYCIQVLHIFVIGFMCNILIFNSSGRIIQFMVSFLLSIVLSVLIANVFFFA